jgi:hypothetical protein
MITRLTVFFLLHICVSSSAIAQGSAKDNCAKKIKFYITTVRILKTGALAKDTITAIADPVSKQLIFHVKDRTRGKMTMESVIVSQQCSLDLRKKKGKAVYTTYLVQKDGHKADSTFTVYFNEDELLIEESDPVQHRAARFSYIVDKWEFS